MDTNKPEHTELAPHIGPVLNRTVGHLAGCIKEFGLFYVTRLLPVERALLAVGIELVVSAVGLHHETNRFASGRHFCSVEQFIVSFWHDNIRNIIVYRIVNGLVNTHS